MFEFDDYYGNHVHSFSIHPQHEVLTIAARSLVQSTAEQSPAPPPMSFEEFLHDDRARIQTEYDFLNPSPYVPFSDRMKKFFWIARPLRTDDVGAYVQQVVAFVRDQFSYEPGVTRVYSTVDEILTRGRRRMPGLRASHDRDPQACRSAGALCIWVPRAATGAHRSRCLWNRRRRHAWIEAQVPGQGWAGFDPTHGCRTDTRHIKVAIGRDYSDVTPLRGVYRSFGSKQTMTRRFETGARDIQPAAEPKRYACSSNRDHRVSVRTSSFAEQGIAVRGRRNMKKENERDYRLDFCRGLALILIFIDHVPGNPASHWTLRKWAFCDAAEVFVLISGISSYLAYGSKLDKFGFKGCCGAVARRLTQDLWRPPAAVLQRGDFRAPRIGIFRARRLRGLPASEAAVRRPAPLRAGRADAFVLAQVPRYPAAVLDPARGGARDHLRRQTRSVARADHVGAGLCDGAHERIQPERGARRTRMELQSVRMAVPLYDRNRGRIFQQESVSKPRASATAINGHGSRSRPASPCSRWSRRRHGAAARRAGRCSICYLWPAEKTFLSPLRVANVVALLYLFVFFVPKQAKFFSTRAASLFLACGRNSLPVYGVGVVLSCAGYVALSESDATNMTSIAVNVLGIFSLFMLACVLDWRRKNIRALEASTSRAYATALVRRFVG